MSFADGYLDPERKLGSLIEAVVCSFFATNYTRLIGPGIADDDAATLCHRSRSKHEPEGSSMNRQLRQRLGLPGMAGRYCACSLLGRMFTLRARACHANA